MRKIEHEADLMLRKEELESRIEKLEEHLANGEYNVEILRERRMLLHHLRVCDERIKGVWMQDRAVVFETLKR